MPNLKVLRSFNKTPQGDLADIAEVDDTRAQELTRLGLAEVGKTTTKTASAPANKARRARTASKAKL
jgi:hypothetical protein